MLVPALHLLVTCTTASPHNISIRIMTNCGFQPLLAITRSGRFQLFYEGINLTGYAGGRRLSGRGSNEICAGSRVFHDCAEDLMEFDPWSSRGHGRDLEKRRTRFLCDIHSIGWIFLMTALGVIPRVISWVPKVASPVHTYSRGNNLGQAKSVLHP